MFSRWEQFRGNMKTVRISKQRGFNLIEVLIAVFILLFMALMFAAVVPSSLRSIHTANYYNLAAIIAQRKMDQLADPTSIGYKNLTVAQLKGKILSDSTTGSAIGSDPCEWYDPAPTSTGTGPVTASDGMTVASAKENYMLVGYFTKIDKLRTYKNNGSAACSQAISQNSFPGDSNVEGKMVISGWQGKTAAATDSQLLQVTITITWQSSGQGKSSYTATTLIPKTNIL